jgi:hypothetical protein
MAMDNRLARIAERARSQATTPVPVRPDSAAVRHAELLAAARDFAEGRGNWA